MSRKLQATIARSWGEPKDQRLNSRAWNNEGHIDWIFSKRKTIGIKQLNRDKEKNPGIWKPLECEQQIRLQRWKTQSLGIKLQSRYATLNKFWFQAKRLWLGLKPPNKYGTIEWRGPVNWQCQWTDLADEFVSPSPVSPHRVHNLLSCDWSKDGLSAPCFSRSYK